MDDVIGMADDAVDFATGDLIQGVVQHRGVDICSLQCGIIAIKHITNDILKRCGVVLVGLVSIKCVVLLTNCGGIITWWVIINHSMRVHNVIDPRSGHDVEVCRHIIRCVLWDM